MDGSVASTYGRFGSSDVVGVNRCHFFTILSEILDNLPMINLAMFPPCIPTSSDKSFDPTPGGGELSCLVAFKKHSTDADADIHIDILTHMNTNMHNLPL